MKKQIHTLALVAGLLIAGVLWATQAGAAGPPPAANPAVQGEEAIRSLGGRLPDVARSHGLTTAALRASLRSDLSLRVDPDGRLLYVEPALEQTAATQSNASALAALPVPPGDVFQLHSRPGANRVIYIDFDGHLLSGTAWNINFNGGDDIVCPPWDVEGNPDVFTDSEQALIYDVWQRVAEDYAPFEVDVTTEFPGEDAMRVDTPNDQYYGTRALVSEVSSYIANAGGIAYVGVFNEFTSIDYKPALVFPENLGNPADLVSLAKNIAEVVSHEVGHNLNLLHDGIAGGTAYYYGHGSGETGWAPIMGAGYLRNLTQWSKGEYDGADNTEDDLAIMTQYGLPHAVDDHGDTAAEATPLAAGSSFAAEGIIGLGLDQDVFALTTETDAALAVSADPAVTGPNLDILLELTDADGTPIASGNPSDGLAASLSVAIPAGTHYLTVGGTGKGDPATGYSAYGSLGAYRLSGTLSAETYTITPSAGPNGTISPDTAQLVVPGGSLTFTMTPDAGYQVADLLVDGTSVGAVTSHEFTAVSADHTIAVSFEPIPPATPANVAAEVLPNGHVQITWDQATDSPAGFEIERSTNGGPFENVASLADGTATSWTDTTVQPGTTYAYRMRSFR